MTKLRATPEEAALIYIKLGEVGQQVGEGVYKYNPGWNDERVVQEVAPRLNKNVVNHIRSTAKAYGVLYKLSAPNADDSYRDELADLTKRINELETLVLQQGEVISKLQSERIRNSMPTATVKSSGIIQKPLPLLAR